MLFYMQMRNWFLIFLMLTVIYLIQQKSNPVNRMSFRASLPLLTIIR